MRCRASVTCLDCSTTFNGPASWKPHTTCISEAQKYQKSYVPFFFLKGGEDCIDSFLINKVAFEPVKIYLRLYQAPKNKKPQDQHHPQAVSKNNTLVTPVSSVEQPSEYFFSFRLVEIILPNPFEPEIRFMNC
jgi:hypothetical protein